MSRDLRSPGIQLRATMVLLCSLLVAGCGYVPPLPEQNLSMHLNGAWDFQLDTDAKYTHASLPADGWQTIPVPGNWYAHGHDHSGVAWYRRSFNYDKAAEERVFLEFQGVDYFATVWVNGQRLGSHEGYFQPFRFEVGGLLKPDNTVIVRVDSPREKGGADWSLRKRLIKGVFSHHDTRPGGAWSERGQEANSGGIWAPVALFSTGPVTVGDPRTRTVREPDGQFRGWVDVDVDSAIAQELVARFVATIRPLNGHGPERRITTQVKLKHGQQAVRVNLPKAPARPWEPWERGEQPLYQLTLSVIDGGGNVLGRNASEFGFRSVNRDAQTGTWRINGQRMFLRGTNYIPTHWLSRMDRAAYRRDLELMKAANINIVRVHASVIGRAFYEEADRAGMLVWQDFPLQWGYADTAEVKTTAESQVVDMVRLLWNHPSVVAWSMHNEPPWDATWMKWKYKSYREAEQQNRTLDEALLAKVTELDDGRYRHLTSRTSEHPWLGWYSGSWLDYLKPTDSTLVTEFGAQALPSLATLETFLSPAELWPDTEADWNKWAYHNFQKRESFEIAKIPQPTDTDDFIRTTQSYQANLIAAAAESYRRQRYQPVGAIFQFMFVEAWPSMNWGVMDYRRQPKSGYEALRRAYQPVLPGIEWQNNEFAAGDAVHLKLWAINDLPRQFPDARLTYRLRRDDEVVARGTLAAPMQADSGRMLKQLSFPTLAAGNYRLDTEITATQDTELGVNSFSFEVKP